MEPLLAALERPLMNRWFFYFNAAQVRSKESGVRSRESTAPPSELIQSIRVYLCYPWPAFLYFLCLFVYFVANPFCRRQKNPCISVLPACRQAGPWLAFLYFFVPFRVFRGHPYLPKAKKSLPVGGRLPVIRIGFKPMTYCLEGSCSIQLSYRTKFQKNERRR